MLTVLYTFEACSKTITAYSSLNYIPVFVEYVQKIERIKMRKLALFYVKLIRPPAISAVKSTLS